MSHTLPVIFGLSGTELSSEERAFFTKNQPLGFILFSRNISDPEQVRHLISDLKSCVIHKNVPILIDQEGGKVRRLRPPHFWDAARTSEDFADIASNDLEEAIQLVRSFYGQIALELASLGVTHDCAPVADLRFDGAHDVIGNRSFGSNAEIVSALVEAACLGLKDYGIEPIIKHIPGHGRALVDSHKDLPRVPCSLDDLKQSDFIPFVRNNNNANWAMTAHIVYECLDKNLPATQSVDVINYIRSQIGFLGTIISDDLSMEALQGTYYDRARLSTEAGCDVLLHCNGKMDEMSEIARYLQGLSHNWTVVV